MSSGALIQPVSDDAHKLVSVKDPTTKDISHGELLRDGYDETMTIDLNNLRMLYQGRDPAIRTNYGLLPYRLGLLTLDQSTNPTPPTERMP